MTKKPKVTLFKVDGASNPEEALESVLEMLAKGASDRLEEVLRQDDGQPTVKDKPCVNPLCPTCMHEYGLSAEAIGLKVRNTFALLEKHELVEGMTILYGVLVKAFRDLPEPFDEQIMEGIVTMGQYLRNKNEKFAFATDSGRKQEGAKH